jgi:hypothetical protein
MTIMRKLILPRKDGRPHPPSFEQLHPAYIGRAKVLTVAAHLAKQSDGSGYIVDLGAGTCTCQNGAAWQWAADKEKWIPNLYCSHKIRMMADILQRAIDIEAVSTEMQVAYAKAVGSRYNVYEVVSAFHKELRRGNVEHAVFWGTMLANFRGVKGVTKYMLNIVYEETRDHPLGEHLVRALNPFSVGFRANPNKTALENAGNELYRVMLQSIAFFCESRKKWELPHRMQFLEAEMRGYKRLIEKYGRDVAKAGNIIPRSEYKHLMDSLKNGIATNNLPLVQYGLKGLQKMQTADIDAHRATIINEVESLVPVAGQHISRDWSYLNIKSRLDSKPPLGIGYHELNAFVDLLCGEPYSAGFVDRNLPEVPKLRLGVAPNIPIYAQDNHTWAGKALIRKYPNEWQPGAIQKHMDLRLCGAYIGVVWRHLAYKQHGRIDCEWEDVKWPKWLSETVANLWY